MTIQLLSNGLGLWFAQCYWCRRSSPDHDARDDLRVLAKAKAAGWLVEKAVGWVGEKALADYEIVCPRCSHVREIRHA